jgi:hypothetical protein
VQVNIPVKISHHPATDQALIGRKPKIVRAQLGVSYPDQVTATAMQNSEGCSASISRKLPVQEAAAHLNLSVSCLNKKRVDGSGPPFLKLGRRIVYDIYDLERWAAQTRRLHTSA